MGDTRAAKRLKQQGGLAMNQFEEDDTCFYGVDDVKEMVRKNNAIIQSLFEKILEYKAKNQRLLSMIPDRDRDGIQGI